jgi:formiminotetrahydrofolate cyclodeaminase
MKNLGLPLPAEAISNFDAGANIEDMRQQILKAGFNQVKHWRQAMNQLIRDGEAFVNFMPSFPKDRELTDEEKKLRAEMVRLYDELSGKDSFDLATFEIIVIVAFKD